ncbi:MAG: BACON domain-containing protein, partial [Bacteroidales bacterium]|nr:BACON domain-containing protein [Bacteroidales bacterium]
MKKVLLYLTAALAAAAFLSSCNQTKEPEYPDNAVYKVTQSALIDAAASAYAKWEEETVLPETLSLEGTALTKAGEISLTAPQYQYALAKALTLLADGKKDDIVVLNYKPATHPDRDSYDQKEIPVTGGSALEEGTEDLVSLATRFVADIEKDKNTTIPNRVLVQRKGAEAMAFSTNRLTVCLLRALAGYKKASSLPQTISTDYLSAAATLKGFAQQFVQILDIWEKTVGTVSADGSHCTDNNSAWQNVHFVPIPHSGGAYVDGVDQYDPKYQPYFTVTIDGTTYTSAQTWGIALRGIVDMITKEGSAKYQAHRNPFEHTMGNGAAFNEPIPATIVEDIWGKYPWYESTIDGPAINLTEIGPNLIARLATWFLARQSAPASLTGINPLGMIGNYQIFGTDPSECIVEEGVNGFVSSMRMWLIAARFYKYLLDNNITENVYDAVKDVKFSTDLYGVEMPDIELRTKSVTIDAEGTAANATFIAKKDWTATASDSWIHIEPASGSASEAATIAISADANKGEERTGTVLIKGGNVTDGLAIAVTQAKYVDPSSVSLKDFAKEFVKGLDVWAATVGTVESENKHLMEKGTAWENVHFIPVGKTGGDYDNHPGNQHDPKYTPWTLNVNGTQFTSAQAWEIAVRGLLDMVLTDGQGYIAKMTSRNKPGYTLGDNKAFSEIMTVIPSSYATWGKYPWYEEDGVTYNGEPLKEAGIDVITKATLGHLVRGLVGIPGVFNPLGMIGNFQEFGSDDSSLMLDGYKGLISPMRELILMMRVYKHLLDNNIDANVYSAIKDVKFDYDMYGQGVPETPKATVADFIKEFAKAADAWDTNVGTVSFTRDGKEYKHENVHFIPENFTITLNGTSYNKLQMHEMAMRSLLAIAGGAAVTEPVTEPGSYKEATSPYYEYDEPLQEKEAGVDLLINFATRCTNYLKNNGEWPNVCGYPRTSDPVLTTYNGYVCIERNLIMLARLCREIVEKNLTTAEAISAVKVSTDLWGEGISADIMLKDFAKEFVKGLDVWAATVGTVESENKHLMEKGTAWENVHFIPVGKTGGDYDNHPGNQHDPKYTPWTLNVKGTQFTSAQAWEIAIRGLLDMVLTDGQDYIGKMTSRNKPGYTLGDNKAFSEIVAAVPSSNAKWGKYPWYEEDGVTYNGEPLKEAGVDVITKATLGHLVRGLVGIPGVFNPLGMIGNFQEFGNDDSSLMLTGYKGLISPMRELILLMRLYKHLLDNNIDANVYSAIKDVKFDYDMYGKGSSQDDGVIKTADQLLAYLADPTKDAELGANIDLTGKEFTPGRQSGTLDGKNFTVTYTLDVTEKIPADVAEGTDKALLPEANVGLFKFVSG